MSGDFDRRLTERLSTAPHVLRDYAFLGDGERGALVGPRGDIGWMCFPRWDDDAVFTSLIGGRCTFAVSPRGRYVWGGYYEPGSLIWRSRWILEGGGIVECREALALPGDRSTAILLRRLEAVRGPSELDIFLRAGAAFDRYGMSRLRSAGSGWEARLGEGARLRLEGADDAAVLEEDGGKLLWTAARLEPGESRDLILTFATEEEPEQVPADRLWAGTEAGWKERLPDLSSCAGSRDATHSYAVMSGLTSVDGGMVAASTMSLPERADHGRNYDYRYAWMRDQAYAGQAVAAAGPYPLMDTAVGFVAARLLDDGADLMPAYTVAGEPIPLERSVQLPGYPGGRDIAGNRVREQLQLDSFGEALLLFAAAADHDHLGSDEWRAADVAAAAIEARREEPDAGIWELDPARWTHGRLICAAGLRAIAPHTPGREEQARRLALADAIVAEAAAQGLHPEGHWQQTYDDPGLDAALLLPALRGAVPADDPRSRATLEAVLADLTEDGYCYRFRPDERPLGEAEGAFLLCGFWVSLSLSQVGRRDEAMRWFERNRTAAGPAGLLSEEFDVRQRQLRGNLPQAFVHALLLECAARLGGREGGTG